MKPTNRGKFLRSQHPMRSWETRSLASERMNLTLRKQKHWILKYSLLLLSALCNGVYDHETDGTRELANHGSMVLRFPKIKKKKINKILRQNKSRQTWATVTPLWWRRAPFSWMDMNQQSRWKNKSVNILMYLYFQVVFGWLWSVCWSIKGLREGDSDGLQVTEIFY